MSSTLLYVYIYIYSHRHSTRWWFQTFFIFTPTWGNDPNWLIFFKWVETTNSNIIYIYIYCILVHVLGLSSTQFFGGERVGDKMFTFDFEIRRILPKRFSLMSGDSIKAISITATVPHSRNQHETQNKKHICEKEKDLNQSFNFASEGLRLRIQQLYLSFLRFRQFIGPWTRDYIQRLPGCCSKAFSGGLNQWQRGHGKKALKFG